jgi:hypothetical protein
VLVWVVLVLAPMFATSGEFRGPRHAGGCGWCEHAGEPLSERDLAPSHRAGQVRLQRESRLHLRWLYRVSPQRRRSGTTRTNPKGRRPLEDIWLVDDKNLAGLKASGVKVKMIRVDIRPVLDRGVQWCRNQR